MYFVSVLLQKIAKFFVRKHLRMIVVLFRNDIRICKVFGNEIDEYLESIPTLRLRKTKASSFRH